MSSSPSPSSSSVHGGYYCRCNKGYTGVFCQGYYIVTTTFYFQFPTLNDDPISDSFFKYLIMQLGDKLNVNKN